MRKSFKVLMVLIVVLMGIFAFSACDNDYPYNTNLIENGDFEQTGSTLLYWHEEKAVSSTSDGVLDIKSHPKGDENNEYFLEVSNGSVSGNYIKIYQKVNVKKGGIYKITAKIKNDSLTIGRDDKFAGAGIQILENGAILSQHNEVTDDWVNVTVYAKAKNCDTLTVALIFGNEDAKTKGAVAFDDISMVRVKGADVPKGAEIVKIHKSNANNYPLSNNAGVALVTVLAIFTVLIIVGAYFLYRKFIGDDKPISQNVWLTAGIIAVCGIALRLILAGTVFDAGKAAATFETLKEMVDHGGSRVIFNHPELSPFQAYYFWIIGKICYNFTSLGAVNVMTYLFPAFCEGLTIAMIYIFGKKYVNDKQAMLFASLYAVLPVSLVASSGLSVELPVLITLLLFTFMALVEKEYIMLLIGSLITCLWSEVGIYILPFIVAFEIYMMVKTKDKKLIITMCVGWFVSFWLFILLSAPAVKSMFREGHIMYIFKSYYLMMFNEQVCVSNAFNIYSLFGLNGGGVNKAAFWLNIVFTLILLAYSLSLYFKNYNRAEMMLITSFFLGIISVFSLNMSEIALAVCLILLLMYIIISGDERLFWVFGVLSFMAFMNIAVVMNYSGALGEVFKYTFFNKGDAGYAIANVITGIAMIVFGWFVYDITTNDNKVYLRPLKIKESTPKN